MIIFPRDKKQFFGLKYLNSFFWVKIFKFFDADADPGFFLTLDQGWKKFGSVTLVPGNFLA
jgi:hypothetical protein